MSINVPLKKKLLCLTCRSPHNGRVGAGKFCTIACSKRVGARARWSGHKRGGTSGHIRSRPLDKPKITLAGPQDPADHGLRGEKVILRIKDTKVCGIVKEYSARTDKHCVIDADGRTSWVNLRTCEVVFDDNFGSQ